MPSSPREFVVLAMTRHITFANKRDSDRVMAGRMNLPSGLWNIHIYMMQRDRHLRIGGIWTFVYAAYSYPSSSTFKAKQHECCYKVLNQLAGQTHVGCTPELRALAGGGHHGRLAWREAGNTLRTRVHSFGATLNQDGLGDVVVRATTTTSSS